MKGMHRAQSIAIKKIIFDLMIANYFISSPWIVNVFSVKSQQFYYILAKGISEIQDVVF
jgi:hypothetical protein